MLAVEPVFDDNVVVPFIVRGPGVVKPGSTSDALVSTIDILPTVAEVAGAGSDLKVDGCSLVPLLKQEAADPGESDNLYDESSATVVQRDLESRLEKWTTDAAVIPSP